MVKYTKLDDLPSYKISCDISDKVCNLASRWDFFNRDTLGKQIVRSCDSIAANIAEAYGRYHKKDKVKFYYNARGSLFETQFWLKKSYNRNLMSKKDYKYLINELRKLPKKINILIKWTMQNLKV